MQRNSNAGCRADGQLWHHGALGFGSYLRVITVYQLFACYNSLSDSINRQYHACALSQASHGCFVRDTLTWSPPPTTAQPVILSSYCIATAAHAPATVRTARAPANAFAVLFLSSWMHEWRVSCAVWDVNARLRYVSLRNVLQPGPSCRFMDADSRSH